MPCIWYLLVGIYLCHYTRPHQQCVYATFFMILLLVARTFQCPPGLTWEALPDPSDCSHYFLCVGSQAHHRACSPHLYFNPLTERCDSASKPYCAANSSSLPTFNNTAVHMTAPPPTTSPPSEYIHLHVSNDHLSPHHHPVIVSDFIFY